MTSTSTTRVAASSSAPDSGLGQAGAESQGRAPGRRARPGRNVVCMCRHLLDSHRAGRGCLRCACAGARYRKRNAVVIRDWWRLT